MKNKHLIGILPEDLAKAGFNPALQIVPAWFGFRTHIESVPEQCEIEITGLVDGDKAKAIMEKVLTDTSLIPCSFMQNFYLFRALEKTDMYSRTEEAWKTWYEFLDLHCTTFPETPFDPRSDCHAWSSLPLYEF